MNTTTEVQSTFGFTDEQTQLNFSFADKDSPVLLTLKTDLSITFYTHEKIIGKLDWNDGIMKFSGSADESAQLLFDCIIKKHTQDTLFDQQKNNTEMKS